MSATITRASHETHSPTTSTNRSMPARTNLAAGAPVFCTCSGATNLPVIDRLAVARPGVVLPLEAHVRVVHLLRDRVLGDRFGEHLVRRRTQALHHGVRQGLRDHALVLDEVLH